jgi:hypothetical protein
MATGIIGIIANNSIKDALSFSFGNKNIMKIGMRISIVGLKVASNPSSIPGTIVSFHEFLIRVKKYKSHGINAVKTESRRSLDSKNIWMGQIAHKIVVKFAHLFFRSVLLHRK